MPAIDLSLQGLLEGNLFNFLILAGVIAFALYKVNISAVLERAKNAVAELLQKSDDEKTNSQKTLEAAKKDAENLPAELEVIKNDAQNAIESFKKAAQAEIEQTVQRLEHNAQKSIENEVQKINSVLQREAALNAVNNAHKKTVEGLSQSSELHRKFINDAINKIEEIEI